MLIGSIAALMHGVGMPSTMIIFGDTVDTLIIGTTSSNLTMAERNQDLEEKMSKQAYYYLIIAAGVMLTTYIQVCMVLCSSNTHR